MRRSARITMGVLIALNAVVLLGQIWPEGAPPFAQAVNIGFLAANLVFLGLALRGARRAAA